jgi:hypothetical protein
VRIGWWLTEDLSGVVATAPAFPKQHPLRVTPCRRYTDESRGAIDSSATVQLVDWLEWCRHPISPPEAKGVLRREMRRGTLRPCGAEGSHADIAALRDA